MPVVPISRAIGYTSQKSICFRDPGDNLLDIVRERPSGRGISAAGRHDSDRPFSVER